jgi:hypothetical protein
MLRPLVVSAEQKRMTEEACRKVKERVANEQKLQAVTTKRRTSTGKSIIA